VIGPLKYLGDLFRCAMWVCLLLLAGAGPCCAQLATSFYTVTGIETRRLPNAVQIVIRTDGSVIFGGDLSEWVETSDDRFEAKRTSQIRLRLLRARASIPAFNTIGAYPVDAAAVSLGRDTLSNPYFPYDQDNQPEPRVDITLRFYVPILVQRFQVGRFSWGTQEVVFGSSLDPLDCEVRMGDDRRSIVVTVITDRVDAGGEARLKRIKPDEQKTRLKVEGGPTQIEIDALHASLPDLLSRLGEVTRVPVSVRPSLNDDRATLRLSAPLPRVMQVLGAGLGLSVRERGASEGGGYEIGTEPNVTERLPLRHISPERARLLLPDWLLPFLRVDVENNSLFASASAAVVDKLKRDLATLDRPRAQVRVQAEVYEVSRRDDEILAYSLAFGQQGAAPSTSDPAPPGTPAYVPPAVEAGGGTVVVRLPGRGASGEGALSSWRVRIEALRTRGRARLVARPFIVVASGAVGTLFLGQTRFVPVLRLRNGQQDLQALRVPVGYSIEARPRVFSVGDGALGTSIEEINLDVTPRVSTVDDIERGTGLPTLGIREVSSSLRLRSGDALLVAGLNVDNTTRRRDRRSGERRADAEDTRLIVLITAALVGIDSVTAAEKEASQVLGPATGGARPDVPRANLN
jgi:hypothetical protein